MKTGIRQYYDEEQKYKEEQERKRKEEERREQESKEQELKRAEQTYKQANVFSSLAQGADRAYQNAGAQPRRASFTDVAGQKAGNVFARTAWENQRNYGYNPNFPGAAQQRVFNALDQNPRAQELQYINDGDAANARAFQQYLKGGNTLKTNNVLFGNTRSDVPENPYRKMTTEEVIARQKREREVLPEWESSAITGNPSNMTEEEWERRKNLGDTFTDEQKKLFSQLKTARQRVNNLGSGSTRQRADLEKAADDINQKLLDTGLSQDIINNYSSGSAKRTYQEDLAYSSDVIKKLDDQTREYLYQYMDLDDEYQSAVASGATGQLDWDTGRVVGNEAGRLQTARDAAKQAFMSVTGVDEEGFEKYLRDATVLRDYRENQEQAQQIYESQHTDNPLVNTFNAVVQTGTSVLAQPVAGVGAVVDAIRPQVDPDAPTNIYGDAYDLTTMRANIQGQTSETIAEAANKRFGDVGFTNPLTGNEVKAGDIVDVVDTAFTPKLRVRGRVTRVVRKVVGTGATEGTVTITNNADPNINYAQRNALIRQAKDLHHFEGTTKKVIDSYKTQGYASRDSIRAGEWKAEIDGTRVRGGTVNYVTTTSSS
jgi:hypothetical protein